MLIGDAFGKVLSNANKENNEAKNEDKKLRKFLGYFNSSWDYQKNNHHERWDRNWKLYNGIRTKKNHPGNVEAFVPMTSSMVNTILSALFNTNPQVRYIPNYKDQESDTKVLNELYDDFARRDNWVKKNKKNGKQGLITGNFAAYYSWIDDKNGGYVHKEIVPIRDMIIDPNAPDYESWEWVGRRFTARLSKLKAEKIYDFDKEKYVPRYKNLNKISAGGSDYDQTDKSRKNEIIGSISTDDEDMVELIEIWTKKEVVVIANRSVIIEDRENPHYAMAKSRFEVRKTEWELAQQINNEAGPSEYPETFDENSAGLLPFAHGCDYDDISLPYGTSDVDIIADHQELLNTITELYIEAELYTIYPEGNLDPQYATYIDQLEHTPGKIRPLPVGAFSWDTPPQIPSNLFTERMNIKDEIREVTAVSQITKGVSATDSTTATEIKAMLGQSDLRIQDKAQNLANGFFFQEAQIVLKFLQLYATDKLVVRTITDTGVTFTEVDMEKFLGEYTPMITLDVMKKLEDAERREQFLNAYQMLIKDPTNNLQKIKQYLLPKILPELDSQELNEIIGENQNLVLPNASPEIPEEGEIM